MSKPFQKYSKHVSIGRKAQHLESLFRTDPLIGFMLAWVKRHSIGGQRFERKRVFLKNEASAFELKWRVERFWRVSEAEARFLRGFPKCGMRQFFTWLDASGCQKSPRFAQVLSTRNRAGDDSRFA